MIDVRNMGQPMVQPEAPMMAAEPQMAMPMAQEQSFQPSVPKNIQKLKDWTTKKNIADDIEQGTLDTLGQLVVSEYDLDKKSREEWDKQNEEAMQLASMIAKKKSFPHAEAANIVYPLVSMGAVQFASRTLPTVVREGMVVKAKVVGKKTNEKVERADRISDHMSFQLAEQMDGWYEDMDSLLHYYAVAGVGFKKTYWCVEKGKPESVFLRASDVTVHYWTKTLDTAKRITHEYELTPNELATKQRTGEFLKVDLGEGEADSKTGGGTDSQNPYLILEQSRCYDLDDDGYAEPVNIFVHKKTNKVLRITARWEEEAIAWNKKNEVTYIDAECYYTKFFFMPSIDGSFYGIGLGRLLGHSNKVVNSIINQMLDAATLQNAGGGLVSDDLEIFGANRKSGKFVLEPGTWLQARDKGSGNDLRGKFIPFNFQGPSPALFELLGLIIESSQRLGQSVDVLSGDVKQADQPATTTLALIEQATKFFTAVRERLFNSLKNEYRKIHRLNRRYLEDMDYNRMLDDEAYQVAKADYQDDDLDVVPVADPREATDAQRLMKAQAVLDFLQIPISNPRMRKAGKLYLDALQIEDSEDYLPSDEEMKQPPADVQLKQGEMALKQAEIAVKEREIDAIEAKLQAEILQIKADAIYKLANAEAKEAGSQLAEYKAFADHLIAQVKLDLERMNIQAQGEQSSAASATPQKPTGGLNGESTETAATAGSMGGVEANGTNAGVLSATGGTEGASQG